jgi:hypothetical protein
LHPKEGEAKGKASIPKFTKKLSCANLLVVIYPGGKPRRSIACDSTILGGV